MANFRLKYSELLDPIVAAEIKEFMQALSNFLSVEFDEDGSLIREPAALISDLGLPVSTIIAYGGTSVPTGWLLCDGGEYNRASYATLFAVIGTSYGIGNGTTTFNVPDFRKKFLMGKAAVGTGSNLGDTGGAFDHTHTGPSHTHSISSDGGHTHTGPSHTHTISADGTGATGASGTGATGAPSATVEVQLGLGVVVATDAHTHTGPSHTHTGPSHSHSGATGAAGTGATSSDGAHTHTGSTGAAGAGNTGTANPPYTVVNYLILYV